ncbi:SOS response-associated peptidase [Phenylobacterium sp.]|uniref:SOS response-associated peptidase n=1 Tax=Phenylobacterium sp. TaxID=1871053 RepID=UPI0035B1FDB8
MCNEVRFRQSLDQIVQDFEVLEIHIDWPGGAPNLEPRDSIRPTDPAAVLVGRPGGAELRQLRWGFPRPKGGPVINFRSEGRRFATGRCLVLVDGFYEFTGDKSPKSKWLFTSSESELFCIAGLIREDRFTLLTCAPGPDIAPYHDRQVVMPPRSQWAAWLDPGAADAPPIAPSPAGFLQVERVR